MADNEKDILEEEMKTAEEDLENLEEEVTEAENEPSEEESADALDAAETSGEPKTWAEKMAAKKQAKQDKKSDGYKEKIYLVSGEYYKDKIKSISDLENIPLVTFTSNKELRSNIDSLLTKLSINPNISFECENLNSIHDLILSNNGIGFIPEFTSGELRKDLYLIDLPEIEVERYIDVKRIPYGIGNEEIVITFYNYLIECFKRKRIITL